MSYFMDRSAAEFHGIKWPKEVACVVNGRRVTYQELLERKRLKQAERLERVTAPDGSVRQAAHIWVFYVAGFAYGGWHLYIRTIKNRWWCRDRSVDSFVLSIMTMFPCGVLPIAENFYDWKIAFAKKYRSKSNRHKRKQACVAGWVECDYDGSFPNSFTLS